MSFPKMVLNVNTPYIVNEVARNKSRAGLIQKDL